MIYKIKRTAGYVDTIKAASYEIKYGALIFYDSDGDVVKIIAAGTWTDVDKEVEYL